MGSISISQLANEIVKAVQEYTEDVSLAIEKEVEATAKEVLEEVRRTAPRKTGGYVKGFKITKQSRSGHKRCVVWNRTDPTRVHLLEYGHAKVNGGRVQGQPHLGPAHDKFVPGLMNKIKQIIKRGG